MPETVNMFAIHVLVTSRIANIAVNTDARIINHIVVSPNKNILFTILPANKERHCFDWPVSLLLERKEDTSFTMIFLNSK